MGVAEVDREVRGEGDVFVSGKLGALIPRQRPAQMLGQGLDGGDHRVTDRVGAVPVGQMQQDKGINMQKWAVDYDFVKTMGLQMASGRAFDEAFPSDSTGIIINEAAAKVLGEGNPIGRKIFGYEDAALTKRVDYTIIGVVKNFHFESLRIDLANLVQVRNDIAVINLGNVKMQFRRHDHSPATIYFVGDLAAAN